jgi:hypothetical protein
MRGRKTVPPRREPARGAMRPRRGDADSAAAAARDDHAPRIVGAGRGRALPVAASARRCARHVRLAADERGDALREDLARDAAVRSNPSRCTVVACCNRVGFTVCCAPHCCTVVRCVLRAIYDARRTAHDVWLHTTRCWSVALLSHTARVPGAAVYVVCCAVTAIHHSAARCASHTRAHAQSHARTHGAACRTLLAGLTPLPLLVVARHMRARAHTRTHTLTNARAHTHSHKHARTRTRIAAGVCTSSDPLIATVSFRRSPVARDFFSCSLPARCSACLLVASSSPAPLRYLSSHFLVIMRAARLWSVEPRIHD